MARPVVLSNGQLFVGLDENGLVHDFYYPYVGLENLTTSRRLQHKIGIWVNGEFKWTDDGSWKTFVDFEADSLVSNINLNSPELKVSLHLNDFIDPEENVLIRRITVTNESNVQRDIRIFLHQIFQISRGGRADTALYVPDEHYILDYKGRYSLLISGKINGDGGFDQFAIGNYGIEGKSGTFKDAEDGELSNNPVEHGGVDTVLRFRHDTKPGDQFCVEHWIVAGDSQGDVQKVHRRLKSENLEERLMNARLYWGDWLRERGKPGNSHQFSPNVPDKYKDIVNKSLLIIKAHCDERGSVLASGDSTIFNFGRDYYCYCWPRDAAYAIWPLIRLGHYEEPKKFFEFARDTMHKDGYLMHKYQPDRTIGSTWHPLVHGRIKELAIQEDETAIVMYMLGEYWRSTKDKEFIQNFYRTFIEPAGNFMAEYIDRETGLPHASYDLWEQTFLTSTYTASAVIGGLEAASELANVCQRTADSVRFQKSADSIRDNLSALYHPDGYFRNGILLGENGDIIPYDKIDISSLYGPHMFAGLELDDPRMKSTLEHVEKKLLNSSPIGGVIRHEHDSYFLAKTQYLGNPWIVCSMWLAQYYIELKEKDKAQKLLDWTLERAYPSGALSEQFDPETGYAIGVTPLVWSHAELVNTILDFSKLR